MKSDCGVPAILVKTDSCPARESVAGGNIPDWLIFQELLAATLKAILFYDCGEVGNALRNAYVQLA